MFGKLFLLFTILPLVDLYLLLQIGGRIGGAPTLALVLITGFLGAALARSEGTRVLRDVQRSLAAGSVPADGALSGVLVLLGGALLIAPGVLTDALGLLLLVPFTRRPIARLVVARLKRAIERGAIHVVHAPMGAAGPFPQDAFARGVSRRGRSGMGEVIDVEGETVEPRSSAPPKPSLGTGTDTGKNEP